jgi:processive 1,2-diacylglycerol beta-glucosyltransferase
MSGITRILRKGSRRIASRWRTNRIADLETPPVSGSAPRIVILSASVGSGHVRAAQAIESALSQMLPDAVIAHLDVLKLTNAPFRRVYSAGYFRTVAAAPHLVAMMYDLLDRPSDDRLGDRARCLFERLNFTRVSRFLVEQPWDLAISTHFLPPGLISALRRAGRIDFPHATVVTDFDVHGMWVNDASEQYCVATEEARANLLAWGIPAERVGVSGIPIDPRFADPIDSATIRRRLGLSPDRPVVLQMAGGLGMASIETIFTGLTAVETPLQLLAITGKNSLAKEQLERLPRSARHECRILGFADNMHELLAAADLIVSKPGGLTTSESLARGCPMAIVEPIPGQEDRNADFLLENGCAIKVNNLSGLTHKIGALLAEPGRLAAMRRCARRCARPLAAFDVAEACTDLLRGNFVHSG